MLYLALLGALIPGLHSWWTGRALLTRLDDPAFPELLLARGQRRIQIAVTVALLSAFVPGGHGFFAVPLVALSMLVGGFPFRRALYAESWSLPAYIGHSILGFVGAAGLWFALAFSPFIIFTLVEGWTPGSSPVDGALVVGAVVAIGLLIWDVFSPQFFLGLHRASPIHRPDLKPRFDEIVARSAAAMRPPQIFRFGFPGAYVMNAFALPSVRQPRIAFGDSLLELLAPDEIVAVFAHEVAHLEHYNRRRMLRLRALSYLLILGGTALPALTYAAANPTLTLVAKLAWPTIVITLLALRVSKSQAHETESDLRSAALTGDPEAMVRALTKLHHYSRMPRRWPYDFERAASHPSLARRIQALRTQSVSAATAPRPKLDQPVVLRSTEPGAYAVLDDGRAYWFDGVPEPEAISLDELRERASSYRAVAYTDLSELRVAVARGGGRALLARDSSGKTWAMPIRPEDVASAQQALDVLDVRLGDHPREDWRMNGRAAAILLALSLVSALDFGWTWLPLILTLIRPSAGTLAAMGSMVVARVVLGALGGTLGPSALGGSWWAAWIWVAAMLGIGVWSCRLAWRWSRGEHKPVRRPFVVVALAAMSVLLVGALAISAQMGSPVARSPFTASTQPSTLVALFLLGFGAWLATYRDKARQRSGAAMVGLGLLLGAGSTLTMDGVFPTSSPIEWASGTADVTRRMSLTSSAYRLHLSPTGRHFAVQSAARRRPARYEDSGDEEAVSLWRFILGDTGRTQRTTEAFDLAFLDDERILALRPTPTSGDSLDLSIERASPGDSATIWRRTIPAYYAPTLSFDRRTGVWRVNGYDTDGGAFVTSVGRIGRDSVSTTRLTGGLVGGRPLHTYSDGTSLMTTLHGTFGWTRMALSMFGFYPYTWDVWHVATNGERRSVAELPGLAECGPEGDRGEAVVCVVMGRSGMTLWSINRDSSAPTSLGMLAGETGRWDIGANGRVAAVSHDGNKLSLVDPTTRRGTRIELGGGVRQQGTAAATLSFATDVAVASGVVATLVTRDGRSELTFYRVK